MQSRVRIIPWLEGQCSFYAIERDGVCLPELFIEGLAISHPEHAEGLWNILNALSRAVLVRQQLLRPERPELGVFALYNHKEIGRVAYNPSRLLCSYAGDSNRIMLVSSGFIKSKDESIQRNVSANNQAEFLSIISKQLNSRITHGEVLVVGSELIPTHNDSLDF